MISFVFIGFFSLSLFSRRSDVYSKHSTTTQSSVLASSDEYTYKVIPIFSELSSFPIISAQAVLATDLESGISLYEKDPDAPLFPASTTKMVTALVTMDYYPKDQILRVGSIKVEGQKMGLVFEEEIRVEDLLYGLLIFSANDAAEVLAQNYSGGRATFIEAMNLKVEELGLKNTHFSNPTGLDGNGHMTSARDLVQIAEFAMKNKDFSEIVRTKEKTVKSLDGRITHRLVNINELLGTVDGVLGVKTGWTENARENLVTYLERDDKKIMVSVLGSQDRFGETKELINWIFENYDWKTIEVPYLR